MGQNAITGLLGRLLFQLLDKLRGVHAAGHADKMLHGLSVQLPLFPLEFGDDLIDLVRDLLIVFQNLKTVQQLAKVCLLYTSHALSVPDIDSYVGLMHTLFTLEDNYGLKISEMDGEVCLKVDVRKNKDAARLHEMLCSWQQASAMLEAGEISKEDYDKWRYHYPDLITHRIG